MTEPNALPTPTSARSTAFKLVVLTGLVLVLLIPVGSLLGLVHEREERAPETADRVLSALRDSRPTSGPLHSLDMAPEDDEPETPEEQVAVEEAMREIR